MGAAVILAVCAFALGVLLRDVLRDRSGTRRAGLSATTRSRGPTTRPRGRADPAPGWGARPEVTTRHTCSVARIDCGRFHPPALVPC